MAVFRGTVLDTPDDIFSGGQMRVDEDAGIAVQNGEIVARGRFVDVHHEFPDMQVVDLSEGLILPGFVDTHVHYPQVRVIGGLGMPLLDWLEQCALPEEAKLAHNDYARQVAGEFVRGLASAGTTSSLVFGSHFCGAVDALFSAAAEVGLRVTSGLVVSDRLLREDLHTTPEIAFEEGLALARRWHGVGRLRYATTPRFSLSCSDHILASCAALLHEVPGTLFTSHLNENLREIATVTELFDRDNYLHTYDKHGLLEARTVLAHNVHPTDDELTALAERDATVSHCPTSNAALGSGMFPLTRHLDYGVKVAFGSDVGAGTGFSLLKEGLQAYFMQQLLGEDGFQLKPSHLLQLATTAGAQALGLDQLAGDLSVGKQFDAQWLRPPHGTTLDVALRHAVSAEDALAKAFALGTTADVASVWVGGDRIDSAG